jgi:hypothetical protein
LLAPSPIEEWKEAECETPHEVPNERCSCGIYAFNSPADMRLALPNALNKDGGFEHVSGVIGAKGVIWEHEDKHPGNPVGFRCQKAKVLALFDAESSQARPMEEIAAQYNVPIITEDHYDAFCKEHRLYRFDWQS